jgi:hypothetical protein
VPSNAAVVGGDACAVAGGAVTHAAMIRSVLAGPNIVSIPSLTVLEMITSTDLTPRPSKPRTCLALTHGSLLEATGNHLRPPKLPTEADVKRKLPIAK